MLKSVRVSLVVLITTLSLQIGYATSASSAERQLLAQLTLSGDGLLWNDWESKELALAFEPGHLVQKNLTNLSKISLTVSQLEQASRNEQDIKKIRADQLFSESLTLWQTSRWQDAFDKLEQALALYREINDRQGEGRSLTGLGKIADHFGQYPQALEYYQQALAISRETGDHRNEGVTLNNIGLVYAN